MVARTATPISALTGETLDAIEAALGDLTTATATTRKQWHARLFGLRALLFECGQFPTPPKRRPSGATPQERLAVVPAAEIRRAMAR